MRERPILFGGEMVRAILGGRKTQTRRVINPQPEWQLTAPRVVDGKWLFGSIALGYTQDVWRCPYGKPGDHLWVRETWAASMMVDDWKPSEIVPEDVSWWYKAGEPHHVWEGDAQGKWRPSIFMPRWASRITLEVTAVRVERVQDTKPIDALKEGIEVGDDYGPEYVARFARLWDEINAKRGYAWDNNPWVWVVEFEVVG